MIFHTNKHNTKVQSLFKGRVSLLQPAVSQGNCSIIINDLTESDSGKYKLRVNGLVGEKVDGYTYPERAVLSVQALTQKPSVMIPPLTEGQPTTLTCTAPGLCSGSDPEFTWTWRGAGEKDSQITGNITAFKTEDLTAVTQSHSSTLTFNPSAEHHSSSVTCEVHQFGENKTVNMETSVSLLVSRYNSRGWTLCRDTVLLYYCYEIHTPTYSLPDVSQRNCSIIINDLRESDSGEYQLRVIQADTSGFTFSRKTTVTVKALTQKPSVMIPPLTEGQPTTLTCTAPGLCSGSDPEFTWTWRGAGEKDSQITGNITAFKTEDLTAVTQSHSST
ncbi:hypothetical protein KUCAC02_014178 [Chaenocephalus aceratus]|uniref:Uncharacterized protein n=1 Tax=Chaenocephalus aceratus TaxID=36190 RepID=A0ACB9WDP1_CHAAC|nr:hypothetical protein KUCAC02_014178 [Chaenocephalus aceratus]